MGSPLREIRDLCRQPVRVQAEPQDIDRRLEQLWRHAGQQRRYDTVGGDQRPVAVDRQRGERFVPGQHPVDRRSRHSQRGVIEIALGVGRSESRREQHRVSFAQRHLQPLRQPQHHLPARPCLPGLDKAEVTRRDLRLERQRELAQPAPLPPFPQQIPDGPRDTATHRRRHALTIRWTATPGNDLRGNRRRDASHPPGDLDAHNNVVRFRGQRRLARPTQELLLTPLRGGHTMPRLA